MLESEDKLERIYGWDALRLVFTQDSESASGYDPRASTEDCRAKIASLKATLDTGPQTPA